MTLDELLDSIPAWRVKERATALERARKHHMSTGGSSTAFYTAVADTLAYKRFEALEEGKHQTAEYLGELLLEYNLGIAIDFAGRFRSLSNSGLTEEYRAAAIAGLWQAISSYQPGRGSFSSWAYNSVRRAVSIAVRDNEYQTGTQGEFDRRPRVLKAAERLGEEASIEEIAAEARVTVGTAARILEPAQLVSNDRQVRCRDGITFADILPDSQDVAAVVEADIMSAHVRSWVRGQLNSQAWHVVVRRYGLDGQAPMENQQIADLLGMSREKVRKIHEQALTELALSGKPAVLTEQG